MLEIEQPHFLGLIFRLSYLQQPLLVFAVIGVLFDPTFLLLQLSAIFGA
jgi:hypothetical protein